MELDTVLQNWQLFRHQTLESLSKGEPLILYPRDRHCRDHCMQGCTLARCSVCSELRKLTYDPENIVLEVGEWEGRVWETRKVPFTIDTTNYTPRMLLDRYYQNCTQYGVCVPDAKRRFEYRKVSSGFDNAVINSYIIDSIANCSGLITPFQCGSDYFFLREKTVPLRELSYSELISSIEQLVDLLHELEKVSFSHGHPVISSLGMNDEGALRFHNLMTASSSYRGYRWYACTPEDVVTEASFRHYPVINTDGVYYTLNYETRELLPALMHLGAPLYTGSLDLYCFLTSMYVSMYDSLQDSDEFKELWTNMWTDTDLSTMDARIDSNRSIDANNLSSIMGLLSGVSLDCHLNETLS